MLDRDQLETFASAVSQRIRALEESLSLVLLVRDRPVVPTPAGEVLLRHVTALRILEGSVLQELAPTPTKGHPIPLAIAVNADSLATWFPKVLKELLLSERVALEVVADDQDHTAARLSRGEVIGCITTDPKPATGFLAEPLGAMEYRCYATPAFQQAHFPDGFSVQTVLKAPAILFNRKDALPTEFLKHRFGFTIDRFACHYLPSPEALLSGIALGAGYGLAPSIQAEPLVTEGRLVDICPGDHMMVDLLWHHWELEPALASDISALIVTVARRHLTNSTISPPLLDQPQPDAR